MRKWLVGVVVAVGLSSASPAFAKSWTLEGLNLRASASQLRDLRKALFRLGVQGARIDLGTGRLHIPRRQVDDVRLARALARAGFPLAK